MKSLIYTIAIILSTFSNNLLGQTSGTLTFSVTTTEPSGGFTGKHVIAIWITDASGKFVKTSIKYAATREQYLNQWVTSSSRNVVDAITGATLTSHGTLSCTWNGTNTSGSVVTDGTYQVWLQMADQNVNGQTASVSFVKGPTLTQLNPANTGNFTAMSLKWTPSVTGISSFEKSDIKIYPNPSSGKITIDTGDNTQYTNFQIVSANGKILRTIDKIHLKDRIFSIDLAVYGKGIYFLNFNIGSKGEVHSVLID